MQDSLGSSGVWEEEGKENGQGSEKRYNGIIIYGYWKRMTGGRNIVKFSYSRAQNPLAFIKNVQSMR